jgi:hypothetical protein
MSLHFVSFAFATENMPRLLGASVFAPPPLFPAAHVCTNPIAARNLLFGYTGGFL